MDINISLSILYHMTSSRQAVNGFQAVSFIDSFLKLPRFGRYQWHPRPAGYRLRNAFRKSAFMCVCSLLDSFSSLTLPLDIGIGNYVLIK